MPKTLRNLDALHKKKIPAGVDKYLPKARSARQPFVKISKPYLKEELMKISKTKGRLDQKRLLISLQVYQFSQGGKIPLGKYWHTGRNKGQTRFNKEFRVFLGRSMGLKRRQIHRYLKDCLAKDFIIKTDQYTFTGEFEYRLNPACGFIPKAGENWLKFYIPKKSEKKNVFVELEKALKKATHKKEWDPKKMTFGISRSTRWLAKRRGQQKPQDLKDDPQKKEIKARIQYSLNIELKKTEGSKKNQKSEGEIRLLIPKDQNKAHTEIQVPWYNTKAFSFQGSAGKKGLYYKGQAFFSVPGQQTCYKALPKKKPGGAGQPSTAAYAFTPAYKQYQENMSRLADSRDKGELERTKAWLAEMKAHSERLGFKPYQLRSAPRPSPTPSAQLFKPLPDRKTLADIESKQKDYKPRHEIPRLGLFMPRVLESLKPSKDLPPSLIGVREAAKSLPDRKTLSDVEARLKAHFAKKKSGDLKEKALKKPLRTDF